MSARKFIAKLVRTTGILLGLGALALFANVMWPVIAADPASRNAVRDVAALLFSGFGVLALVAWPFSLLADYIDPPPLVDAQAMDAGAAPDALTSAPRSRREQSTASRPEKPR
jgi:hypothetical protein